MSVSWIVVATMLLGIGLIVLAGRIRRGGVGPRPSIARGIRGRRGYGKGRGRSIAEIERERIERERAPREEPG
ncbi:MAG TPA: hypothetical protein VKB65_07610 [Myxococcota bacterium]|nr:hypothetical protein [Myxococcota bacterium]